jgi:hypothetical protein
MEICLLQPKEDLNFEGRAALIRFGPIQGSLTEGEGSVQLTSLY